METVIIIVGNLCIFMVMGYIINIITNDKIKTIRELTKSLMAKNLNEYAETIPEEDQTPIKLEGDEPLEDVGNVNEEVLIQHLKEEYENIQGKN